MPPLAGLRVVHSGIHGYGVVAARAFAAGEHVSFGDGVAYPADEDFDDTYALLIDGAAGEEVLWDLVDQTRWFNHSCDPNTEVLSRVDPETGLHTVWWQALRAIAPGEEITYDYAFVAEVAEPCACGTAACRGLIVDPDPAQIARLSADLRRMLRQTGQAA